MDHLASGEFKTADPCVRFPLFVSEEEGPRQPVEAKTPS